jgi:hypothetical protein
MAIQTGIIQFTGKIGNIVGRKLHGKYIIQEPGGFTAGDEKKNKPNQKRITENRSEFRSATNFALAIYNTTDVTHSKSHRVSKAYTDLIKKMVALQRQLDTVNPRGKRQPQPFMLDFLVGDELNPNDEATWKAKPVFEQTNPLELTATMAPPADALKWPKSANACAIFFYTIALDTDTQTRTNRAITRHLIPASDIDNQVQVAIPLFEGHCLVLAGIEFYQEVNNTHFFLNNRSHNPLYIAYAKHP